MVKENIQINFDAQLWTADESIAFLRTSTSAFYRGIKSGKIPKGKKVLGRRLFQRREIQGLVCEKTLANA